MMKLTEDQFFEIIDFGSGYPEPLQTYDGLPEGSLSGWVYDRDYGIFYVDFGKHTLLMCYLLAFRLGYEDYHEMISREPDMHHDWHKTAEIYVRDYPVVYGSMAGGGWNAFKSKNMKLTDLESDILGRVTTMEF